VEVWYVILNLIFAIWVLFDGHRRKVNAIAWAIGTFAIGPIIFPVYIAKRPPLKAEEFRKGETPWYSFKSMAFFWTIVVWTLLLALAGIWKDRPAAKAVHETPEYKLSVYSARDYVSQDDDNVDHFRSVLDRLSEHYVEDRQQIMNISVLAQKKAKVCGAKNASLLDIMEGMDKIFCYNELKDQNYAEYAAIYVRLRKGGQSHKEAIETLQAIVRGY
jgi:hypothetical protein